MESAGKINLLLVEDNPADIYLFQSAIADYSPPVQVWHVPNGDHALAFLRQESPFLHAPAPALIFLDLHIPGHDGYEVLAELRTLEPSRTTPIIIISGSRFPTEEARSLELGANAYVQKSSDLTTYFGNVQAVMGKWLVWPVHPR